MVMPLLAQESGILHQRVLEGALLSAGDIIANLDLDNPNAAQQVTVCEDSFPHLDQPLIYSCKVDQRFKTALSSARNVMRGGLLWLQHHVFSKTASIVHPFLC